MFYYYWRQIKGCFKKTKLEMCGFDIDNIAMRATVTQLWLLLHVFTQS